MSEDYAGPVNCRRKDMGLPDHPDDHIGPAHPDYSKVYGTYEYWEAKLARKKPAVPVRATVLRDAEKAVCQDRNAEYGEPIDNFSRWAGACNALGYRAPGGRDLKPHDLAMIMGLGKLSRAVVSPDKDDTWTDLAGYAAVAAELVELEG